MKLIPNYLRKEEILCGNDVCVLLDIGLSTLWRWRKYNNFPSHKDKDSKRYYKKSEIIEWLKQSSKTHTSIIRYNLEKYGFI